jgi:hypothetical protein
MVETATEEKAQVLDHEKLDVYQIAIYRSCFKNRSCRRRAATAFGIRVHPAGEGLHR